MKKALLYTAAVIITAALFYVISSLIYRYVCHGTMTVGKDGNVVWAAIHGIQDMLCNNATYVSKRGTYISNTAVFKDNDYFKNMKDRIATNWHPPVVWNHMTAGYNLHREKRHTRLQDIPSQDVRLSFIIDRDGNVEDIFILESKGNRPLDMSCIDAVRLSKCFGRVPGDVPGEHIIIGFIFGYYLDQDGSPVSVKSTKLRN